MRILVCIAIVIAGLISNCKTESKKDAKATVPTDTKRSVLEESEDKDSLQFLEAKEGFLDGSTFQVVVSSVEMNETVAKKEASDLGRQRAFNLLVAEAGVDIPPSSRKELQRLVEENGGIAKESQPLYGRYYYLYQVKKSGLRYFVTKQLK